MKKSKVRLKAGRGLSGLVDLTITVSPEELKNPPLTEKYIQSPRALNHNPYYDNKAIFKQPLSDPNRSLKRGQIIPKPVNTEVLYAPVKRIKKAKVFITSKGKILLKSGNIPYPHDQPNQWGIDDGTTYWDDTAKNSMKSIKVYAPEQEEVQRDPKLYETKPSQRIFHHDPALDTIQRNSPTEHSQAQDSKHYQTERIENDKIVRFQEDYRDFKDNKITTNKSQRNSSPRLSILKNIL